MIRINTKFMVKLGYRKSDNMKIYRQIYKKIKKYKTIVLAHHIGPDPDALGSTFGFRDIILKTFPNKNVYVVGASASKFRYLGIPDRFDEAWYQDALLIVLDTPDIKRVDGVDPLKFKDSIKIDHHPFIEEFCALEWVDSTASSASQMVMELVGKTRFKMPKEAAPKLFTGLVADTERFLHDYTTPKTFELVAKLIKDTDLAFTKMYLPLYMRPIKDLRFQGYIMNNLIITDNGFGYIKLTDDILDEYGVDAATAGNLINNFSYINEVIACGFFSYDRNNNNIRGSIRSRGPVINEVLTPFGGGGHAKAAGVKAPNFEVVDEIIAELDRVCGEYQEHLDS